MNSKYLLQNMLYHFPISGDKNFRVKLLNLEGEKVVTIVTLRPCPVKQT